MARFKVKDLTGKRFGRLVVINRTTNKHGRSMWYCICSCDTKNAKTTTAYNLTNGRVKSCGCLTHRSGRDNPRYKEKVTVPCSWCRKDIEMHQSHADAPYDNRFCKGTDCHSRWISKNISGKNNPRYKDKVEVACAYCGKAKTVLPCIDRDRKNHFCKGADCHAKWCSENRTGKNNPNYNGGTPTQRKIRKRWSAAIRKALKRNHINKGGRSSVALVNYSLDDLEKHLKSTLPAGYDWERDFVEGKGILHIDHITPVSVFNFKTINDPGFKKCFALKNLQLLPAIENIQKGAKLDKHFQPSLPM